ncbi:MAG: hypothetical protein ACK4HG_03170 [Agrobacterium albertimagni]|uniref:Uncharacterized protein n=1 Tax=Agrobacterium albertimagni TaxID=147266 RepID=A0A7C1TAA4_9HYPH
MTSRTSDDFKDVPLSPPLQDASRSEYAAWKAKKIMAALRQTEDRTAMIPADEVWERFEKR